MSDRILETRTLLAPAMRQLRPQGGDGYMMAFDREETIKIVAEQLATIEKLKGTLEEVGEHIRLTREYVGEDTLPEIDGWEWYEAMKKIKALSKPASEEG